jgi:Plasmid pRiA4b ORF-3-like protein
MSIRRLSFDTVPPVAPDEQLNRPPAEQRDLIGQFQQAISGLGSSDVHHVLQRLLALGAPRVDPFVRTPPPSRRRPRRRDVVTYQVRVDLVDTRPPLWRRLELASDLFLDDVHDVIQVAFGWTDSHLHRFGSGPNFYGPDTEYYLCPFDVEEGETGVPEDRVRLDEVLVNVGDKLYYNYDFGDDWQHIIKLEAITPRADVAPRVACTDGRRPGPPEDCGGVYAYELIVAAGDSRHPNFREAAVDFNNFFGDEADPGMFELTDFDIDEINEQLSDIGMDYAEAELPGPLADLVHRMRSSALRRRLLRLIRAAALDQPVLIDPPTAVQMVRSYAWLLNRVGPDGIKLTSAGYLPPVHVEAAMTELGMDDWWIGRNNRESHTVPVLDLRVSAQKMGLLRKHRGMLVLSKRGHIVRSDPVKLWWELAKNLPVRSTHEVDIHAGLLLLVALAAGVDDNLDETIAELLNALGWMRSDGTAVTDTTAAVAAHDTEAVLRRLGVFSTDRGPYRSLKPTAEGIQFARAALRAWPDGSRRVLPATGPGAQ